MADNNLNHELEILEAALQANALMTVSVMTITDAERASRAYHELQKIDKIRYSVEAEQLDNGGALISALGMIVFDADDAIDGYYDAMAALSAQLSVAACEANVAVFAHYDNFVNAHFALYKPMERYFREVPSGDDCDFAAELAAFNKDIKLYERWEQPAA